MAKKSNKQNSGTELVTLSPEQYPALTGNVAAALAENLAGEDISPDDLTRIKIPTGGSLNWTVLGAAGEEHHEYLDGVILHLELRRAYWPDPSPEKGRLPQCISYDWITGVGTPGGECASCRFNQWGTQIRPDGSRGKGKACKQMKLLFDLREGRILPDIVCVSPGSLKPIKHYQMQLAPCTLPGVVTRLELARETSRSGVVRNPETGEMEQVKGGIEYAQLRPSMLASLDAETVKKTRSFANELRSVFQATQVYSEEVNGETGGS